MNRKQMDRLISYIGAALAAALVIAGGLLTWGYNFANTTVSDQLAAQNIYFPPAGETFTEADNPKIFKWAGQQVTTGKMAEGYSEHYIAHHMVGSVEGWNAANPEFKTGATYAEVSTMARTISANPDVDPTIIAGAMQLRETMFMGNTLRGLLLEAYAFWMFGQIAFYASIAAFSGAVLFAGLSLLGFRHAKKANLQEN
jgi:hypothetical protein